MSALQEPEWNGSERHRAHLAGIRAQERGPEESVESRQRRAEALNMGAASYHASIPFPSGHLPTTSELDLEARRQRGGCYR